MGLQKKPLHIFLLVLFFGGLIWAFLFAGFIQTLKALPEHSARADGLVVLTGGPGRINKGFELLAAGRGERLLLSGINPDLDVATIMRDIGQDEALKECCVDAENNSTNTLSNAREAITWARQHGYKSLILITSDYHLPRSVGLFEEEAGDIQIIPYPVKSEISPLGLALEFNKYLLSLAGVRMSS